MNRPSAPDYAYVGRKKCGCYVFAVVDIPGRKETASSVAEAIRDGLTIERLPIERVRQLFKLCKCDSSGEQ